MRRKSSSSSSCFKIERILQKRWCRKRKLRLKRKSLFHRSKRIKLKKRIRLRKIIIKRRISKRIRVRRQNKRRLQRRRLLKGIKKCRSKFDLIMKKPWLRNLKSRNRNVKKFLLKMKCPLLL